MLTVDELELEELQDIVKLDVDERR